MKFRILLALSFLGAIWSCQPSGKSETNLHAFLPSNSAAWVELNSWNQWAELGQQKVYRPLASLPVVQGLERQFQVFWEPLPEEERRAFAEERTFLLSLCQSGADKYQMVLITEGDAEFERKLSKVYGDAFEHQQSNYAGQEIYHFYESGENSLGLYVASVRGVLIASPSKNLVESAIRQSGTEHSLLDEPDIQALMPTRNAKDLASIFLNMEGLTPYLESAFPEGRLDFLKVSGSWAELDLQTTEEEILLSGLLRYPSNRPYFTRVFQDIRSRKPSSAELIPSNFGFWLHYNIGNIGQYYRQYREYLEQGGNLILHEELLEKLPAGSAGELEAWIDDEMGIFMAGRSESQSSSYAYLKYRGEAEAVEASLQNFADSNYVQGYRGHVLRQLTAQNLLPRLYGAIFQDFHQPFYTIIGNYVVLAPRETALKSLINEVKAGKVLEANEDYQDFQAQMPGNAHVYAVAANPEALELLGEAAPQAKSMLESRRDSLQNMRWTALQLKAGKKGAFANILLNYQKPREEKVSRQWTAQLEEMPVGRPQILKNHVNKKYDLALSDAQNRLFLLDKNGNQLWNVELDGPIMGPIRQIDIFKNNKLQMVFNTATRLYVIDRLGRHVEGFPVELPGKATAPVGVFNYDNARNYRLVVPVGPDLHNYSVRGEPVSGWKFQKAGSDIVSEPQHFSVAGRDIIVCLSANGKLFQLNRRGEERFEVDENIEELKTSFFLKEGESLESSELIAGSNSGQMYVINPKGKIDALYLDESKPADHLLYFEGSYIFSYGDELIVKDPEQPFSVHLEGEISARPQAYVFEDRLYVGAFSREGEEIRLYNEKGELLEGFPVFAQGPFALGSLNDDGRLNVVTYTRDGSVICYRVE